MSEGFKSHLTLTEIKKNGNLQMCMSMCVRGGAHIAQIILKVQNVQTISILIIHVRYFSCHCFIPVPFFFRLVHEIRVIVLKSHYPDYLFSFKAIS